MFDPADIKYIYMVVTTGTVVDTDDPQQEGRLRIRVPLYGDRPYANYQDLPWAMMASPFMGIVQAQNASRGANTDNVTNGQVAYGLWGIPKVGASVLVTCINGDPMNRICLGCLPVQTANHTMPHGRYFYDSSQLSSHGEPEGPLSSRESPIQPLYDNQTAAFGSRQNNFEWRTRGADHQVAGIDSEIITDNAKYIDAKVPDDQGFTFTEADGNTITSTQGYNQSRLTTDPSNDSNVYSWTSPGFHAVSMDDSVDNCRIRIRTTGGFQIILDDTNERMYISTAEGENWIELDQDGNIYMFGRRLSVHVTEDMNFTADGTIRFYATQGIHMLSRADFRIQSAADMNIFAGGSIRASAVENAYLQGSEVNIVGGTLYLSAQTGINLLAVSGNILQTGQQIHLNGPPAFPGDVANSQPAYWTNIVPQHEPWARTTTLSDFTHDPIYDYNSPDVGRQFKARGPNWHR